MKTKNASHKNIKFYLVNGITIYRLLAAPILISLIFTNHINLFKWLLSLSFFTDLMDGFLARRLKVASIWGAKLDSIADDFTIIAAIIGLWVFKLEFIKQQMELIIALLLLFITQTTYALIKYKRITSFHTYLAKISATLQGTFLICIFLFPHPILPLFYVATLFTTIELAEEIILISMLKKWEANVKGLYWVIKRKK